MLTLLFRKKIRTAVKRLFLLIRGGGRTQAVDQLVKTFSHHFQNLNYNRCTKLQLLIVARPYGFRGRPRGRLTPIEIHMLAPCMAPLSDLCSNSRPRTVIKVRSWIILWVWITHKVLCLKVITKSFAKLKLKKLYSLKTSYFSKIFILFNQWIICHKVQ